MVTAMKSRRVVAPDGIPTARGGNVNRDLRSEGVVRSTWK